MTYEQLLSRLTDLQRLAAPARGERTGCCSSYDRRSRYDEESGRYVDWDANDDGGGYIRSLPDGSIVAAELKGPGVIWRSWSAMPSSGAIRVFADGEKIIDRPFLSYFTGFGQDFAPLDLPALCPHIARGYNSFIPIPFSQSLRIELAPGWGAYYHFTYTLFEEGMQMPRYDEAFTIRGRRLLAALDRTLYRRGEDIPELDQPGMLLPPGEEITLLQAEGEGAISRMAVKADRQGMAGLKLRMYWDAEEKPSVCAPMCDFFACTPEAGNFRTWVCGRQGNVLYANWRMPFGRGARITLTNEGTEEQRVYASLDVQSCPDTGLRFCSVTHGDDKEIMDNPAFRPGGERFPDWPLLRVHGRSGRFCGVHLVITDTFAYPEGRSAEDWWFGFGGEKRLDWWWGEGDEKFFVDDEKFPSTFGTGSEDYIGYAWAAEPPFAFFDASFAAMSDMPLDGNGVTSVCRFHICDDIPFERAFEGYIEKYKQNQWGEGGVCTYRVTPYWYEERRDD